MGQAQLVIFISVGDLLASHSELLASTLLFADRWAHPAALPEIRFKTFSSLKTQIEDIEKNTNLFFWTNNLPFLYTSLLKQSKDFTKTHQILVFYHVTKTWTWPIQKQRIGGIGPVCPHWNDVIRSVFHGASGEKRWETTCNSTAGFQVIQERSLISY